MSCPVPIYSGRKEGVIEDNRSFSQLRELVQDYLRMSPPREQAGHLRDVLLSLANVDGNVSDEEQLIMEELSGLTEIPAT